MPLPVLTTKLNMPALRSPFVPRRGLVARLHALPERKLTLVSAPAGFGKTTVMVEWLQAAAQPVAWLSLDESDSDPLPFFTYLVHTFQRIAPDFGAHMLQALESLQHMETKALFTQLINEIRRALPACTLVLDDLHLIDNPELLQGLALLVERQPAGLHLVIITREDPPFPLARLRARGQMLELRTRDLRFSEEETTGFLNEVMHLDLSRELVEALEHRTEGWVAGLQLAAISLQGEVDQAAFIDQFSGSHRFILDYLSEEVFRTLPKELRLFLQQTAILENLTASLCDAVSGRTDSQQVLQQIEEQNLFLIPLDQERRWYRYHHLFAELLRKQAAQQIPQDLSGLHLRASKWYEERQRISEAIRHAREAGNIQRLEALLEIHALGAIERGQIDLAERWICMLPQGVLEDNPRMLMSYAWVLFLKVVYDAIPALLDKVEARLPEGSEILGESYTLRAFLSSNEPEKMGQLAMQALEIVPESNLMVRGLVHMALANAYQFLGKKREAYEQFALALPLHWGAGNQVAAMMAVLNLAQTALGLGLWKRTDEIIREMLAKADQLNAGGHPAAGMAYIARGLVQVHWNCLHDVLQTIELGIELSESGGYRMMDFGQLIKVQAFLLMGRTEQARAHLNSLSDRVRELPEVIANAISTQIAKTYLYLGDLEKAAGWLNGVSDSREEDYQVAMDEYAAWQALRDGDPEAFFGAQARLDRSIQSYGQRGYTGYQIDLLVLRAMLKRALKDPEAALADLTQALALAEPEGELFVFLRYGVHLRDLLEKLPGHHYARKIVRMVPGEKVQGGDIPQSASLVEQLSEREYEVLQWMTAGMTYNEIAGRMMISVNTVRYHVKGLYGKLAVTSRAGAIARAREFGLMS